ncbi:MAG: hypothetical protein KGI49_03385 [Patescibacteria group bacterium]|nr:hypothetical protein [Patescibacteria group bacterium]
MKTGKKKEVFDFIASVGHTSVDAIANTFGLSRQMIHRYLSDLVREGALRKIGKPPKVFYLINDAQKTAESVGISPEIKKTINDSYFIITPSGERKEGLNGFEYWCRRQKLPLYKTAHEYAETVAKYEPYKKDGLIDGMYKLKHTFDKVYLDKIFYLDFYAIERFGKTKLGQLLLYAKQSQDKNLMKELAEMIKPQIEPLVVRFSINAVGFIPPTVKRETQLMKELKNRLNLPLPEISLVKARTQVIVPQKTLTRLEDRLENARSSIVATDTKRYDNVLLIDDALGSGATLNETACKLKKRGTAKKVIGLAITGSFSGFEVISEV